MHVRHACLALLSILLAPSIARGDIAPDPVSYVVIPSLFAAFAVFVVAALARLLLLALRAAVRPARGEGGTGPSSAPSEGGKSRYGKFEKRAALLALLFGGAFFFWGYQQALEQRRTRVASRRYRGDLGAIRSCEVAYYAEWGVWVGNQPLTPVADRRGSKEFVDWDPHTRFSILGFAPEGGVICSYALEGPDWPGAAEGFTARAECDLDGNGAVSVYWITSHETEIKHSGAPF